jgi:hypothetical protein
MAGTTPAFFASFRANEKVRIEETLPPFSVNLLSNSDIILISSDFPINSHQVQ